MLLGAVAACTTTSPVQNMAGSPTVELDPNSRGPVAGVGIEGQDILSMTDKMMRDMLGNPSLANRAKPPQVIVDGEFFSNESSQRINRNLIADRLRIGRGCAVGTISVVLYATTMEDGSRLDALSLLMKGETLPAGTAWAGSPARRGES